MTRVAESERFGWSRIPNNTTRRGRIFVLLRQYNGSFFTSHS